MRQTRRAFLAAAVSGGYLLRATTVSTAHIDNGRTGANTDEHILTPSILGANQFGKLGSFATDAPMYAQPLYLPGVTVSSVSRKLLIAATMANTVYAFDATQPGTAALWSANFGLPYAGYPHQSSGALEYGVDIGIISTPVADVAANRLYLVHATSSVTWVLKSLNLSTGATVASVAITGQVAGTGTTGDTVTGGNLQFLPGQNLQRASLTLANGKIYICFGSFDDVSPWHGWIFAYNASDLTQAAVWCSTPNGDGGGIWQAGGGPSVDEDGNIYVVTGNGTWDGVTNFSQSIVKLSPDLVLLDWFTPAAHDWMNSVDADLGSSRAILIPGTNLIVTGGKDYFVYVVDRTNMGHLEGTGAEAQIFITDPTSTGQHLGIYGGTVLNNRAFFPNTNGKIYGFLLTGTTFNETPVTTTATYDVPGAVLAASSNGALSGILWATTVSANANVTARAGTLRAFNPVTLAEIYNSDAVSRDTLGTLSKFVAPVPVDGKVFVATQGNYIAVYGPLPSSQMRGQATLRGEAVLR